MLAQVLQIFFWEGTPCKNWLISTLLDKAIWYKGTFLQGSMKPLFTTQNRLDWKKFARFFLQNASCSTKISWVKLGPYHRNHLYGPYLETCCNLLSGSSRGPILTSPLGANFDPRGKVVPQGWILSLGVKLSPGGEIISLPLHSSKQ
jgi:hypothetical protein